MQEKIDVIGASRTDAGVHALHQVAHVKTRSKIPCDKLLIALNGLLPEDISVRSVADMKVGFHSQKGVEKKTYRYLIWNERARSAMLRDRAWHVWEPLNLSAMRKAAKHLIGRHDFSAFRAHQSDTKTSVRRVHRIDLTRPAGHPLLNKERVGRGRMSHGALIQFQITGNGFLKYMIRNIVGTLVDVGKGRVKPEEVRKILRSKDRKKAGVTAPASGLYLVLISY